jgi:hypothetical protein
MCPVLAKPGPPQTLRLPAETLSTTRYPDTMAWGTAKMTGELGIPTGRYGGLALLELIEEQTGDTYTLVVLQ